MTEDDLKRIEALSAEAFRHPRFSPEQWNALARLAGVDILGLVAEVRRLGAGPQEQPLVEMQYDFGLDGRLILKQD